MKALILQKARSFLDPTYYPSSQPIGYQWYAFTHMTGKAASIQNKIIRYVVQFFALPFDAIIGCGLLGTMFYNIGAFAYNHLYLKIKKTEHDQWNPTAIKTWGIIATLLLGYSLYRFGITSATKALPAQVTDLGKTKALLHTSSWTSFLCLGGLALGIPTLFFARYSNFKPRPLTYGAQHFEQSMHAKSPKEFLAIFGQDGSKNFSVTISLSGKEATEESTFPLLKTIRTLFPNGNCKFIRSLRGQNMFSLEYSTSFASTPAPNLSDSLPDRWVQAKIVIDEKKEEYFAKIGASEATTQPNANNASKFALSTSDDQFQNLDLPWKFPMSELLKAAEERFFLLLKNHSKSNPPDSDFTHSVTYSLPTYPCQKQEEFQKKLTELLGEENFHSEHMTQEKLLARNIHTPHVIQLEFNLPTKKS